MLQVLDRYSGSLENECHPAGSVSPWQPLRAISLTAPANPASVVRKPTPPSVLVAALADLPGGADDTSQGASPGSVRQRAEVKAKERRQFSLLGHTLVDWRAITAQHCEKTARF